MRRARGRCPHGGTADENCDRCSGVDAPPRVLGLEIAGYEWEVVLHTGGRVLLRRTRFPVEPGTEDQILCDVAAAEWSGDRLAIRRFLPNRGDALRLGEALPLLNEAIRLTQQGG